MITNVIAEPKAKIEAKVSGNGFERTFENQMESFQGKVEALAFVETQGYGAKKYLVVTSNSKKFKVSQWEETAVGAEMWIHSIEFTIKADGKELTRYYLRATNSQEAPIS